MGEDDVAVYVVRADDSLSEADVIAFAIDNLAYYMVPRYVAFIDQIPKTASHKKAKFSLREDAQRDFRGFWDREAHGIAVSRPGAARL
jgi:crotonobetaine/carnitine-CoA ligase